MISDKTPEKPKIAFVVATVYQIKFFMVPHLTRLSSDYDVTLFVRNDVQGVLEKLDLPVTVQEIPIRREISLAYDVLALVVLFWYLLKGRFKAVHTVTPKAGLIGTIASTVCFVPNRIHTFQGEVWATRTGLKRKLFKGVDWLIARLATRITVVSGSELRFLENEKILKPGQGQVLGAGSLGGVDTARFTPNAEQRMDRRKELGFSPEDVVVAFIGRLSADKGLSVLVEAFTKLQEKEARAKLLIVGPDENNEADHIRKAFPGNSVVLDFTHTPENDLIAADILVLPSFREGFGMVALEASSMEIPAVGSDIYGITDAISDGTTGLLFEVRNSDKLFRALLDLCRNPKLRNSLGKAGRKRAVENFTQDKILSHFTDFYDDMGLKSKD